MKPNPNRVVLIDGDIVAYEVAAMSRIPNGIPYKDISPGEMYYDEQRLYNIVDDRVQNILHRTGSFYFTIYFSSTARSYRKSAHPDYKANRDPEKIPHSHTKVKDYIINNYGLHVQVAKMGEEADDAIIEAAQLSKLSQGPINVVIASRDKDLKQCPGFHYTWPCGKQKEKYEIVDLRGALHAWAKQMLMGDSVDNIKGLKGIGKAKADKLLSAMWRHIKWLSTVDHNEDDLIYRVANFVYDVYMLHPEALRSYVRAVGTDSQITLYYAEDREAALKELFKTCRLVTLPLPKRLRGKEAFVLSLKGKEELWDIMRGDKRWRELEKEIEERACTSEE